MSNVQRDAAARRSFVSDCRLSDNIVADVARLLKDHGVLKGKVGVNFEMLSTAWHIYLGQELPQIEWVETHERIMQLRFSRSQEEANIFREGAALGDGGFEAAVKFIRPGLPNTKSLLKLNIMPVLAGRRNTLRSSAAANSVPMTATFHPRSILLQRDELSQATR